MSPTTTPDVVDEPVTAAPAQRRSLAGVLRLQTLSGLYVWALLIIVFSLAINSSFDTTLTLKTTLSDNAITALLAIGAMLPFTAGLIDLSFANVAGLTLLGSTWLSIHTGLPPAVIVAAMVVLGAIAGLGSGLMITLLGINSLVVTLGVATVCLGLSEFISGGNTLLGHWSNAFTTLGQGYVWVIPDIFIYVLVLAVVVYVLIEHTPIGRKMLATGANPTAARLAGLRVRRIQIGTLVASGAVAGFAGVVLSVNVGAATTETGPGYLLPAIAALFLGETQIRTRVNVWGTVMAVLLIGTGIKGLELLGAAPWVNDFFNGAVLLIAVGVAARARRNTGGALNV